jgi:hypothetical protein
MTRSNTGNIVNRRPRGYLPVVIFTIPGSLTRTSHAHYFCLVPQCIGSSDTRATERLASSRGDHDAGSREKCLQHSMICRIGVARLLCSAVLKVSGQTRRIVLFSWLEMMVQLEQVLVPSKMASQGVDVGFRAMRKLLT